MKNVKSKIRALLIKSKLYYLVEPFSEFMLSVVYLSKFLKWHDAHLYQNSLKETTIFHDRYQLYHFLLKTQHLEQEIDYLEFGVYKGDSLRWWLEHNLYPSSKFVGFDTFTGLPEDWGKLKQSTFSTEGRTPKINDSRVSFAIGLFQDTLGPFLNEFSSTRRKVIHLDADLYSSTLFVLTSLGPKLKGGDIIIFDEFAASKGLTHEFRSLCDFAAAYRCNYRLLGAARFYKQVAIQIV